MFNLQYYLNPFKVFLNYQDSNFVSFYDDKPACFVIRKQEEIRYVTNNQTLIIDGHGDMGRNEIIADEDGPCFTAEELAFHLYRSDLNETHVKIRVLSCYGGTSYYSERKRCFYPSFAQRLAIELGIFGYSHIAVGGYTESVRILNSWIDSLHAHRHVLVEKNGKVFANSADGTFILWFDCQGNRINKPQLPGIVW